MRVRSILQLQNIQIVRYTAFKNSACWEAKMSHFNVFFNIVSIGAHSRARGQFIVTDVKYEINSPILIT